MHTVPQVRERAVRFVTACARYGLSSIRAEMSRLRDSGSDNILSCSYRQVGPMTDPVLEGRQSAVDMMALKALSIEDMHGWGISQYIQRVSREVLRVKQGSLYPALHRLERDGYIRAEWRPSDNNRRAKYYTLTASGRRQLDTEHRDWIAFSQAVQRVMQA